MSRVECLYLKPADRRRMSLRRYGRRDIAPCSCCNARRPISTTDDMDEASGDSWPHDDERWPLSCDACGRTFDDEDRYQLFHERLYRTVDGREMTLAEAPPGAMWNGDWWPDPGTPDGLFLIVRLPGGGDFYVDGEAVGGGGWTRNGVAPKLTVRPSIRQMTTGYHGYLVDGFLEACGDSKH